MSYFVFVQMHVCGHLCTHVSLCDNLYLIGHFVSYKQVVWPAENMNSHITRVLGTLISRSPPIAVWNQQLCLMPYRTSFHCNKMCQCLWLHTNHKEMHWYTPCMFMKIHVVTLTLTNIWNVMVRAEVTYLFLNHNLQTAKTSCKKSINMQLLGIWSHDKLISCVRRFQCSRRN